MWKGGSYGMNGAGEQTKHICKNKTDSPTWSAVKLAYEKGKHDGREEMSKELRALLEEGKPDEDE
jgi:hypothetical protein